VRGVGVVGVVQRQTTHTRMRIYRFEIDGGEAWTAAGTFAQSPIHPFEAMSVREIVSRERRGEEPCHSEGGQKQSSRRGRAEGQEVIEVYKELDLKSRLGESNPIADDVKRQKKGR
jgi:hypothetical protein